VPACGANGGRLAGRRSAKAGMGTSFRLHFTFFHGGEGEGLSSSYWSGIVVFVDEIKIGVG